MRIMIFLIAIVVSAFSAEEKTYVTCAFSGQLGNQLFEVAAAIAYALEHGCEPIFPEIDQAEHGALNHRFIFHRLNTSPIPGHAHLYHYYENQHTHYVRYAPIPYVGNGMCLDGFFQTEKYFSHYSDYIRDLFSPSEEILSYIHAKYRRVLKNSTVAIHVRTFIPNGRNPDIDGIGGLNWREYFIKAINYFPADSTFLLFSDSIEWVKAHFPKMDRNILFIEGNPYYIDFYLMSMCTHQIVSPGSTFSWWAAWLNANKSKTVIAPYTWLGLEGEDIIPASWVKIRY